MSTPMRSRLSTKSLTSPPAQKARPAPVTTTQRIAGSSSTSSAAWKSSRPRPRLNALNASGRLSVIVATPSRRSRVKNWKSMAVVLRSGLSSALAGHARNDVQDVFDLQRLHHHQVDAVDQRRPGRSEEHTSELQSPCNLVLRLLLEKKK